MTPRRRGQEGEGCICSTIPDDDQADWEIHPDPNCPVHGEQEGLAEEHRANTRAAEHEASEGKYGAPLPESVQPKRCPRETPSDG